MPKRPRNQEVEGAVAALDQVRREWLRRPGVTAVDVGFKIKDLEVTDTVAVRVHVGRKRPAAELETSEVFNETGKTPSKVGGFPVDVIEATYGPSNAPTVLDYEDVAALEAIDRKAAVDPLIGGVSCGNTRVTAGTIGAIVFNKTTCKPMILSNWHVLAGASAAAVGENIVQPGTVDGGTQTVANLTKMVLDSRMDAAVATLNGARGHTRDILGLGTVSGIESPTLGMNVVKSGRTTAITEGVIDGVSMSVSINYGDPGVVAFSNQVRIVPRSPWPAIDYEVSKGGDSGSVWLNQSNNRAIGLHFAGETDPSPTSENAICSPMGPIAAELNFSFLPVLCAPRPFNICDRFPWICEPLIRYPWPRLPIPIPGPDPIGPIGPWTGGLGGLLGGLMGPQTATHEDCGCGGSGGRQVDQQQLAQLIAAYLQQG
jgi:endonuclease G